MDDGGQASLRAVPGRDPQSVGGGCMASWLEVPGRDPKLTTGAVVSWPEVLGHEFMAKGGGEASLSPVPG